MKADNIKTCYIIGGGPSLEGFNFDLLKGKDTIAVNMSLKYCPFATYFITADSGIIQKAVKEKFWNVCPGTVKVVVMGPDHKRYNRIKGCLKEYDVIMRPHRFDGQIGFTSDKFATGKNTGFCALQWAVLLGYKRIYLLGIDLVAKDGKRHYYGGQGTNPDRCLNTFFKWFVMGTQILKQKGIEVISMSPNSRLNDYIPYVSLEELKH